MCLLPPPPGPLLSCVFSEPQLLRCSPSLPHTAVIPTLPDAKTGQVNMGITLTIVCVCGGGGGIIHSMGECCVQMGGVCAFFAASVLLLPLLTRVILMPLLGALVCWEGRDT
jgi:hypothetical protein